MRMSRHVAGRRSGRMLGIAALVLTAACEQATSPGEGTTLDANRALADYQALDQILSADALAGFRALGERTSLGSLATASRVAQLRDAGDVHRLTVDLARGLSGDATSAKTIISTRHLGKTLVYHAATDTWVVDPARTGAPANGVRFITYENDANGKPIPARETGYADLRDEGATAGEAIVLRLVVVTRGTTALDYRTRVLVQGQGGTINVDGFISDGTARLDFTVGLTARASGAKQLLDADFDLQVNTRNFRVQGTARGIDETTGDGNISMTARHGTSSVAVELKSTSKTLDGRLLVNGKVFATVKGDAKAPEFRGATGAPLTGPELLVVLHIVDMMDDVFDLVEELVEPVDNLVALGWVL